MLETKENIKSLNNCFKLWLNEVLELKEILKELKKNQDIFNIMSKSNSYYLEIVNVNNKLCFKYDDIILIELKTNLYNDNVNKGFKVNYDLILSDSFNTALYIDFENSIFKYSSDNNQINIISNHSETYIKKFQNIDFETIINNELLVDYTFKVYNEKIELNHFIVYFKNNNIDINFLENIKELKLKPKKQTFFKGFTIPTHNLPSLKKEKFNLDKFKEYIYNGILETTFEDLEKNTIEYFYKVERSNFYKEYDIVFKKYSYDEIREIILNDFYLFDLFYNDFINHEIKYNSIESYLLDNFESLKDRIVKIKSSIADNKLINMIEKYEEEVKIKELETYIKSKVNEFTYFQTIYNDYIATSYCLNKSYLDKFDSNLIKGIIEKIEVNLKNKSLELFKIILSDKKLNSKNFKENYDLNINYEIDKSFIEKIRDRFKQNNITLENIETYNSKLQTYRISHY